jgi:hypothetical protein
MEKKQTAVEWLEKAYWDNKGTLSQKHFEQANEIHRNQFVNFADDYVEKWCGGDYDGRAYSSKDAIDFYNETYGETKK